MYEIHDNIAMQTQPARSRKPSRTVTPPVMRQSREEHIMRGDPELASAAHLTPPKVSIMLVSRALHNVLGVQWWHESAFLQGYEVQYGFDGNLDCKKFYVLEGRDPADPWIAFLHDVYDTLHHGKAGCLNARVRVQSYDGNFSSWSDLATWSEFSMVEVVKEGVEWVSDLMGLSKKQPRSSEMRSELIEAGLTDAQIEPAAEETSAKAEATDLVKMLVTPACACSRPPRVPVVSGSSDIVSTISSETLDNDANIAAATPRVELKRSNVVVRRNVSAGHMKPGTSTSNLATMEGNNNTSRNPEKRITLKSFSSTLRRHSCPDLDAATARTVADGKLKKSKTIE
jgi:hypothetical protein